MPLLGEEQVEVELRRQPLVELDRGVVEARALGGLVVGAQDRRVAPGRAGADVALLEHADVGDPVVAGQVVGGREAVRAAADDHHVVAVAQLAAAAATSGACGTGHASGASRTRPQARRPPARRAARRRRRTPSRRSAAYPAPNRCRKRSPRSRRIIPGVRATETGANAASREALRAQVERRRPGEGLARERPDDRVRAERRGQLDHGDEPRPPAAAASSASRTAAGALGRGHGQHPVGR